jgi:hypothetical protein
MPGELLSLRRDFLPLRFFSAESVIEFRFGVISLRRLTSQLLGVRGFCVEDGLVTGWDVLSSTKLGRLIVGESTVGKPAGNMKGRVNLEQKWRPVNMPDQNIEKLKTNPA